MIFLIFITAIIGIGVGVGGRFVFDEIFISLAIALWFITELRKRNSTSSVLNLGADLIKSIPSIAPLFLFLMYFLGQLIRTIIDEPSSAYMPYMVHFLFLCASTVVLSYVSLRSRWVDKEKLLSAIIFSATAFNAVYVLHGLALELMYSDENTPVAARFMSQGLYWSGSAYSAFASMAGLLAAALHPNVSTRYVALLTLSILCAAFFFDSRIALAVGLTSVMYLFFTIRMSHICRGFLILGLFYALFIVGANFPTAKKTMLDSLTGVEFLFNPRVGDHAKTGDYDRQAHFFAGFRAISHDPVKFVFGYGYLSHRQVVGDNVRAILSENPIYRKFLAENDATPRSSSDRGILEGDRTTTFTAVLIDGGALGIALFFLCIFRFCADGVIQVRTFPNSLIRQLLIVELYVGIACFTLIIYLHDMSAYWYTMCLPALIARPLQSPFASGQHRSIPS